MLAKVIAHAADRPAALTALDRALAETAVLGVTTNVDFLRFLLADPDVRGRPARYRTAGPPHSRLRGAAPATTSSIAAAAYRWLCRWPAEPGDLWDVPSGWRMGGARVEPDQAALRRAHRPRPPRGDARRRDGQDRGR